MCDNCYIQCDCAKYLRGERIDGIFCLKKFNLDSLYDYALMTDRQRRHMDLRIDANGTDKQEFEYLKSLSDNICSFIAEGRNLYLYSENCGNGKTSWALRLAQRYINSVWYQSAIKCRVLFISVPKFFIQLKESISKPSEYINHIKKYVNDCDMVIWDDIGTKVGTEFEIENLLTIISNRIDDGKSNIYTSNITPDQLRGRVGDRLYSRVINGSQLLQLNGQDKRGDYHNSMSST